MFNFVVLFCSKHSLVLNVEEWEYPVHNERAMEVFDQYQQEGWELTKIQPYGMERPQGKAFVYFWRE